MEGETLNGGIPNHERLLIVPGMARSGTTILTYVLARHPQVALYRAGREARVLENDCLIWKNVRRIGEAAGMFRQARYVLLKRPWQEKDADWMQQNMPDAHYIIMLRDKEGIMRSWKTTGRWAVVGFNLPDEALDAHYDEYFGYAQAYPQVLGRDRCRIVSYERMVKEPASVFGELADWLEIEDSFDTSPIGEGLHWQPDLAKEFPVGNVLLEQQMAAQQAKKGGSS